MNEAELDALIAEVTAAVASGMRKAHSAGLAMGSVVTKQQFQALLAPALGMTPVLHAVAKPVSAAAFMNSPPPEVQQDGGARAPKGALDKVLNEVLSPISGKTLAEVEKAVALLDPRIAQKSVYNRLRVVEKTDGRFRRDESGKWLRASGNDQFFGGITPDDGGFSHLLGESPKEETAPSDEEAV